MICWSSINGVTLGKTLSRFTSENFANASPMNEAMDSLLKVITTSCRALGHEPKAAQFAQKCYFAHIDHFGLNSLCLSIPPDNLRSFRVQLYANAAKFVSSMSVILFYILLKLFF